MNVVRVTNRVGATNRVEIRVRVRVRNDLGKRIGSWFKANQKVKFLAKGHCSKDEPLDHSCRKSPYFPKIKMEKVKLKKK